MNKLTLIVFSFSLPLLTACSSSMPKMPDFDLPEMPDMSDFVADLSLPDLYKADINQGSVLERFKVNQLKVGMNKIQVQDLIGSPSVIDPFHNNQWDYINYSKTFGETQKTIHYRLRLTFDGDKLSQIDTSEIDALPALTNEEKKLQAERIAKEKAEAQAKAKAEAERIAKEKAEAERIAKEKAEAERLAKQKAEAQAKAKAEAERIAKEKAEAERIAKQKAEQEAAEAERKRIEEANKPWYQFW